MQIIDDAEQLAHRVETRPPGLEATFLDTATSASDELRVLIAGFDDGLHYWDAVGWAPRVDDTGAPVYPQAGDEAAVVLTDKGRAWVLGWRPSS